MKRVLMLAIICICGALYAVPAEAQQVQQVPPVQPVQEPAPVVQKLFREDSKVGFVDLQRIFSESAYGKQGMARVTALQKSLSDRLATRGRDIQALSEKIKTQQTLVTQQVWLEWNGELQRMQREAQFAEQEAQITVEQAQQSLLAQFEVMVRPVIESVRSQRKLWAVFAVQPTQESAGTLSLIAADPAIDLSAEVVQLLDKQGR
jgi:Skp family chaperone for outer membrane proteins